jgi:hypothetical protein
MSEPAENYPLRSISVKPEAYSTALKIDRTLFLDLSLIGFDACAGLSFALWLFAAADSAGVIALGALAGTLVRLRPQGDRPKAVSKGLKLYAP